MLDFKRGSKQSMINLRMEASKAGSGNYLLALFLPTKKTAVIAHRRLGSTNDLA